MSNSGRPCYTDFEDEDINVTENNKAEIVEEISGHVNGDHLLDHEQTEGNENVDDVQAQKPVLEAVEIEQDEELQNPVTAALIDVLEGLWSIYCKPSRTTNYSSLLSRGT